MEVGPLGLAVVLVAPEGLARAQADRQALGGVEGNVLVLPVVLRGKVPVIVFAATARYDVDASVIRDLADQASAAFERLIVAARRS